MAILSFTGGHLSRNSIEKINLLSAFGSLRALNTELNRVRNLILKKKKRPLNEEYKSMQKFIILISVLCFDAIIRSYEVLEEREITLKRIWRNSLKILNFRYTFVESTFFPRKLAAGAMS